MLAFFVIFPPGCCDFTPSNRGKKLPTARTFFWWGLHIKWKLFWNTQREYYRMKTVQVGIFLYFRYIFRFFQNYFRKHLFLEMFKYTKTTCTPPIILLGYFLIQNSLFSSFFSVALTKKKYAPSEVFPHQIGPNWSIRRTETTVTSHSYAQRPATVITVKIGKHKSNRKRDFC